jgi:flagellum-specific ATP synthase
MSERDWLISSSEVIRAEEASQAADRETEETLRLQRRDEEIYSRGFQAGQAEAGKGFQSELQTYQAVLHSLEKELENFYAGMETRTVDLTLALVKKIVGAMSATGIEAIRQSIKKVLARHNEPGELLTLRMHPEDHARMAPTDTAAVKNFKMVPDPGVARGGCIMETGFGLVDARLETQLEELEKVLRVQTCEGTHPSQVKEAIENASEVRSEGRVVNIVGTVIESRGPNLTVGEQCEIISADRHATWAEVIGFRENRVLLMPLGDHHGIGPGSRVIARGQSFAIQAGPHLLGRILNGLGHPIDAQGALGSGETLSIHGQPNNPMQRRTITSPLYTGVRTIDGFLTCGKGGRMGIFAGSGVGKSVLLGMMARNTQADVNVIALIGERGREVREFVERDLGPEGLKRSVVIAVTSDESPVLRIHGAQLAASIAEYFARQGKDVLFMMDSVTRFAMAHREIGLAIGEPPTTKGYTPSTFAALPKLLERSGIFGDKGSITGFYAVLVEGDDMDEPVADHVRSILDGHVVLSRSLFTQNHFPAIDVLSSISRLTKMVCTPEQTAWAGRLRDCLATVKDVQDLLNIGAYVRGNNPKIDQALNVVDAIERFLIQGMGEKTLPEEMWKRLAGIVSQLENKA